MASSKSNSGRTWSAEENSKLKTLAKGNTPTRVIGLKMGRSESAIRAQAQRQGLSLKPTNQSPYGSAGKRRG